ncbi:MAG: hypothetical protein HUK28_03620 [Methanobrevibacter sp.]|nr:hypothetical protein [Methanobrevibacter sp.]
MNNNQLIVIVIAILVAACIIGGAVAFTFNKPAAEVNVTIDNNTTNVTANLTEDVSQKSNNHYIITDEYGIKYWADTGICVGQGEGLPYEQVRAQYNPNSPTACPHGMADPSLCPGCS